MRFDILQGDQTIVPMVMFHTVGTESIDWEYSHIAEPIIEFEQKIAALKMAGYNFVFWAELYDYMAGSESLELPAVALTFDDGYLDNWVYVYPILKRYGAKGTIFMSTDFVDPSVSCRPNMEDMESGRFSKGDLRIDGFLNWEEMRQMQKSGVIDIQSHAKSHTWYFSGPNVVDFWCPGQNENIWMSWNAKPERKPYYLHESQWDYVPFGTPIYEHEKSLECRRFHPADEIANQLCLYVEGNGGIEFFRSMRWRNELMLKHASLYEEYSSECGIETGEAQSARMMEELAGSKKILERELGKNVDYICWPGGGYTEETLALARKAGYRSWTLSSRDRSECRNIPGADPMQVKRIGSAPRQFWHGKDLGYTNGAEFLSHVRRHQGSIFHKWRGRVLKAIRIVKE